MHTVYSVKIGLTKQSMLQLERPMNERGVGKLPQLITRIIRNTTQYPVWGKFTCFRVKPGSTYTNHSDLCGR